MATTRFPLPARAPLRTAALLAALALPGLPAPAAAQGAPAVDFESVLESYFDDESGLLSFTAFDLVLAPEGPCKLEVVVLDAASKELARHGSWDDYRWREGVFARVNMRGPADVQLEQPGVYTLVFLHDGTPITRFQFGLVQTGAGDDPYDPVKTWRFDGPWRMYGHITTHTSFKDERIPRFTVWLGGGDLAEGKDRGMFLATLRRGDEVLAHSKRTTGHIGPGHFERTEFSLYHPHEAKASANAEVLRLTDLADGDYSLTLARQSDDAPLRDYRFAVKDGALVPHEKSAFGFEPAYDHIAPRVVKRGSNTYSHVEAIWMQSKLVY